ncbi:hypothetical protein [Homoserinibacter sp. GY 40078]|uniref:hypothetical protein n=1 Tax=Homoserinibacter sp. GY 40078 TaxID=2603275 RepID=UPI0011CC4237|nr:hypothetical protein [Homoserinibacter sp. GY 40078]TXK16367.1 hypothetical protein FVQ89_14045 [Homoserinibacter sp. GY 40078]
MSEVKKAVPLALALAGALTLSACTAEALVPTPAENSPPPTVTVETRSITSVIVVPGRVVSSPTFVLAARASGAIDYASEAIAAPSVVKGARIATVAGEETRAPVPSRVLEVTYPEGATVVERAPIATLAYAGFGVMVDVPPELAFRVYSTPTSATVSIDAGPAGIDCRLMPTTSDATDPADDTDAPTAPLVCLLPLDATVVAGLPAKIGMRTAQRDDVLALPVSAVLGSVDTGRVTLLRGGAREVVEVTLGVSDGAWVEIVAGLEEGDEVLAFAPGLG